MPNGVAALVTARIVRIHGWLLDAVRELPDEQLAWRAGPSAPPIGFHLWHVARWADRLQATLPALLGSGSGQEVWASGRYAQKWGMDADRLGFAGTGMGMDEHTSAQIPVAGREVLLRYAQEAFEAANQALEPLSDADFGKRCRDLMYARDSELTIGQSVISHLRPCGPAPGYDRGSQRRARCARNSHHVTKDGTT